MISGSRVKQLTQGKSDELNLVYTKRMTELFDNPLKQYNEILRQSFKAIRWSFLTLY